MNKMAEKNVILLVFIAVICVMFSETNTFSLPMIPIDSPHLQIFQKNVNTQQQRLELLRNITMSRVSQYSTKSKNESSLNSIESSLYKMLSNFYITQIFIGTRNDLLTAYVLFDTGAVNTWVQCEGCNPCFELRGGSIPIQKSLSKKFLSKDDPRCNPHEVISDQWCGYSNQYGGGAVSIGAMITDYFMFLNSQTKKPVFFPDIAFGCGIQNHNVDFGLNSGPNNVIAGIMGMSPGPQSLLNQLDSVIKGRFSYCLTSWTEPNRGMSTIHFGDDALISGPGIKEISMNSDARYHLYFRGITVEGYRLPNVDSTLCPLDAAYYQGFIIDSGAPHSILPDSGFQALSNFLTTYFTGTGWKLLTDQAFPLCFTNTRMGVDYEHSPFPQVVFHFSTGNGSGEEIDWVMEKENMFLKLDTVNGFCLVFDRAPDQSKFCVFGAYQHSNFFVLYDVKNSKLSFRRQRCQQNT